MSDVDATGDASEGQESTEGVEDTAESQDPAAELAKARADAKKWKSLSLKHEQKAKAAAEAEKKLQELEHSGKSETEKLQLLLDQERATAREAKVQSLKLTVAADKGLDPKLAKFLPDLDDEVDMMSAADDLLEAAGAAGAAISKTRQPKSNLTSPLGGEDAESQREAVLASMLGRPAP